MIICTKCGNKVKKGDTFCDKCGYELDKDSPEYVQPVVIEHEKKDNAAAITGFVCALCAVPFCFLTTLPGFILSVYGFAQRKSCNPEREGMAMVGIVISSLLLLIPLAIIIIQIINGYNIWNDFNNSNKWGY